MSFVVITIQPLKYIMTNMRCYIIISNRKYCTDLESTQIDFYVNVQNDKIMYIVDVVMDDKLFVCMNVRQRKQAPVSKNIYRFKYSTKYERLI